MKKNVLLSAAAALMSISTTAQIPAEPTTGKVENEKVRFYDEQGRSVFYRRALPQGSYLLVESYVLDYASEGDLMKVTSVGLGTDKERPKFIEKREIVYGSSADDVKAQSEQLRQQAGNLIKAEQ